SHRRVAVWLGVSAVLVIALVASHEVLGHRFRLAIIWAFRLGLVVDDLPALYALPIGLGLGGALTGL
ncbi:MAG TPA: hypothetical protein DEF51_23010, partial [Myxococcales bacterium]|nr:hypothetical protein [Myxococcales bacterium]